MLDICCDCEYQVWKRAGVQFVACLNLDLPQVASRRCRHCKDVFCDTCYHYTHAKGAKLWHECQFLLDMCEHCHDYAAR